MARDASFRNRWWLYLVLTVAFVLVVTPFVWMVLGSVKSNAELRSVPPTWWPANPTLQHFRDLFDRTSFGRYFFHSTVVALTVPSSSRSSSAR